MEPSVRSAIESTNHSASSSVSEASLEIGFNCKELLYKGAVGVLKGLKVVVLSSAGLAGTASAAYFGAFGSLFLSECVTSWGTTVPFIFCSVTVGMPHLMFGAVLTVIALTSAGVAYVAFKEVCKTFQ